MKMSLNTIFFLKDMLMKKKITSIFIVLLLFCVPLYADASPAQSIDLAVKLIGKKDFAAAEKALDQLLISRPEETWYLRSLYLKGHINAELSKFVGSAEHFSKLLSHYPQMEDYILLKLAGVYTELGEEDKSQELFNRLLSDFPESRLRPYAKFYLGKHYLKSKALNKAYKKFSGILKNHPDNELVPESTFFIGIILERQGETLKAYERYVKLFHSYPLNEFSIEAEEKIREMKKSKPSLPEFSPEMISKRIELLIKQGEYSIVSRECKKYLKIYKEGPAFVDLSLKLANVYSLMKKRNEALRIYKSVISKYRSGPSIPGVLYNMSNLYWNLGKYNKAIEYSQKVINKYPSSAHAEKAYYAIGRIHGQGKNYKKAIAQFRKLTKKYKKGPFAIGAHWYIGWINYMKGNYGEAARKFSMAASRFDDYQFRDKFLYWAGKANEKNGDDESARDFYKRAANEYPYSFYGHRGKARLGKKSGGKVKIVDPFLQRNLEGVRSYNVEQVKMDSEDRFHFVRMKELTAMGFQQDAVEEIRFLARKVSIKTPEKILWVANLYLKSGGYKKTLAIIEGFFREISVEEQVKLRTEYWRHYYPLAYNELVLKSAGSFKIDPFFIEGLMRQESSFNPDAFSRSGAIGLMQLMPATGENEFRKRYKGKFEEGLLFDPVINVTLGSQHIAYLLKKSRGDPVIALAGYNAGLTRALKWKKNLITSDIDVFIEMIPYRETKKYVKKVLRNYFNYIMMYGEGKDVIIALNKKDF